MPEPLDPSTHRAWRPAWGVWVFVGILCMLPVIASAQVAGYRLDPVHTRVLFTISHAGYSQAIGTVSGSQGMLALDP